MADLSKLAQRTVELTSAWDERKRLFDRLRDLKMDDDARATAIKDYAAAAKHFEDLRSSFTKA